MFYTMYLSSELLPGKFPLLPFTQWLLAVAYLGAVCMKLLSSMASTWF